MISYAALIRAANLDNLEPRKVTYGLWAFDQNVFDFNAISADGMQISLVTKQKEK